MSNYDFDVKSLIVNETRSGPTATFKSSWPSNVKIEKILTVSFTEFELLVWGFTNVEIGGKLFSSCETLQGVCDRFSVAGPKIRSGKAAPRTPGLSWQGKGLSSQGWP